MERFAELFAEAMPPDAERLYAELGLTPERVAELPHEVGELRTVEDGSATAGYVWLELRERTLHVHALLLEPQFRGRGIGGRVLAGLEDEFRGRVDELELGVESGNAPALRLYERAGFERVGERLGFLIMRKRL
jgi:ribosomal protein S18 acetylase RimI-like enzyme